MEPVNSLTIPIRQMPVAFSVSDYTWKDTALMIATYILKIVIFPWGLYTLARYTIQRLIMILVYPAQSRLRQAASDLEFLKPENCDEQRSTLGSTLRDRGYNVEHVVLERNGIRYSGLVVADPTTIDNGQWVLHAPGNCAPYEYSIDSATEYLGIRFNTFWINNPSVGRSEGESNPDTMGKVQELALRYLEKVRQAKKLVMIGESLGGGAMGQAILQHDFDTAKVQYLSISLVTFGRLSEVAQYYVGKLSPFLGRMARRAILWSGCELDNIESSNRLEKLGIRQIIIQGTLDEVIPQEVSLGVKSSRETISVGASHNEGIYTAIMVKQIESHFSEFGQLEDL